MDCPRLLVVVSHIVAKSSVAPGFKNPFFTAVKQTLVPLGAGAPVLSRTIPIIVVVLPMTRGLVPIWMLTDHPVPVLDTAAELAELLVPELQAKSPSKEKRAKIFSGLIIGLTLPFFTFFIAHPL
jgi:hypothetical protein